MATDNTPAKSASAIFGLAAAQDELDRLLAPAIDIVAYRNFLYFGTPYELSAKDKRIIRDLNGGSDVNFFVRRSFCPWKCQLFRPQTDAITHCDDLVYGKRHEINRYEVACDTIFATQGQSDALGRFKRRFGTMPYPGKGDVKFWDDDPAGTFYLTDYAGRKMPHRSQTIYNRKPSKLDNESVCDHHKYNFARADKNRERGVGSFARVLDADIRGLIAAQLKLWAFADPAAYDADVESWIADMADATGTRKFRAVPFFDEPPLWQRIADRRLMLWWKLFRNVDMPARPPWHSAAMVRIHRTIPAHIRRRHIVPLDITGLLPHRIVEPAPGGP